MAKDVENKQILNFSNDTLYLSDGGQVYMGTYSNLWAVHGDDIYNTNTRNVGVGLENPNGKLVVQGDSAVSDTLPLFEVKNKDGQTIFAVYDGGVRMYVNDDPAKANNDKGGFAIGGYRLDKSITNEYMRVTPDSVRIYIKEENTNKANNDKGGFAIGGYRLDKTTPDDYLHVFSADTAYVVDTTAQMLWYPLKEAFLAGKVLVESSDSVGQNSWATGYVSKSIGNYSQALGNQARAFGNSSTAIGYHANAVGNNSYAFGNYATAQDSGSYAIGSGASALGLRSFALGSTGVDSLGNATDKTIASGDYSYAFGMGSIATDKGSFSFGTLDTASAQYSLALGYGNKASAVNSISMGTRSVTSGNNSISIGYECNADAVYSLAMGYRTKTTIGWWSTAMGYQTEASGYSSMAINNQTSAMGNSSLAMGYQTSANGKTSVSMGFETIADKDYSFAGGYNTYAGGLYSFVYGYKDTANANYSIVLGSNSTASGLHSVAIGDHTNSTAIYSISLGAYTTASGDGSFATGNSSTASGYQSFTTGYYTESSGSRSVAMGSQSIASGHQSFAMGYKAYAIGDLTSSFGLETSAKSYNSFVIGRYNLISGDTVSWVYTDPLFVIGNGISTSQRGNALTVLKNGNVGINISNPASHKLYVTSPTGGVSGSTGYFVNTASNGLSMILENLNSNASDNVLLVTQKGTGDIASFDSYHGGAGWDREFRFTNTGDGRCDGSWIAGGADYAEFFPKADILVEYETGDIITMSPSKTYTVEGAKLDNAQLMIGVYSSNPAIVGNSSAEVDPENSVLVGMIGVIKTKVNTENGPIKIGDYITISSTPKVGMKATKSGMVVGRAMDNYNANGVGLINVLVETDWYFSIEEVNITSSEIKNTLTNQQKELNILKAEVEQLKQILEVKAQK